MKKKSEKKPAKKIGLKDKNEKRGSRNNGNTAIKKQSLDSRKLSVKKEKGQPSSKKNESSGIKKQYLNSEGLCNVTFRLPKEAAPDAKVVTVVGDFNDWNLTESRMKKLKNGDFTLTIKLPCNREYRFRYLIDTSRWENDWCADEYAPNPFGADDSLIKV